MAHPLRIQLSRKKGWQKPAGAVVVSRPGPFGNPFRTAEQFERWLQRWYDWDPVDLVRSMTDAELFERRAWIIENLPKLRGRQLLCWCGLSAVCHADVLAELANR